MPRAVRGIQKKSKANWNVSVILLRIFGAETGNAREFLRGSQKRDMGRFVTHLKRMKR
jgi:hypothetical protein